MGKILIYGSKAFGQVVRNLSLVCGYSFCGFIDDYDNSPEIVGNFDFVKNRFSPEQYSIAIAIGYKFLKERKQIFDAVKKFGFLTPSLIHPSSYIDRTATINDGAFIMANSTIDFNTRVGNLAVVWPGAVINHDSKIGENVFISPNATVCGFSEIGDDIFIGASAIIIDHSVVPSGTVVKAGVVFRER